MGEGGDGSAHVMMGERVVSGRECRGYIVLGKWDIISVVMLFYSLHSLSAFKFHSI